MAESSTLYDTLKCAICLDFATEAVETVCCHQIGCLKCLEPLNECPTCQKDEKFEVLTAIAIRRMIDNIPIACTNECGVKTTRGELTAHLNACPKLAPCPVEECDFTNELDKLGSHVVQEHPETAAVTLTTYWKTNLTAPKVYKCLLPNCNSEIDKDQFRQHVQDIHKDDFEIFQDISSLCIVNMAEPVKLKNGAGVSVKMARNGKFYCERENTVFTSGGEQKKVWCKYSSKTNKNNCVDCMKLDLLFRDLAALQLVNSESRICKTNPCNHFAGGFHGSKKLTALGRMCRKKVCGNDPVFYCSRRRNVANSPHEYACQPPPTVIGLCSDICEPCKQINYLMSDPRCMYNEIWE